MMQKAVFFANYGSPYEGNFIVSLKMLEKRLNERGINVIYLFPMRTKERKWISQLQNNEVVYLPDNIFAAISEIGKILKEAMFVHTHFINMEQMLILKLARMVTLSKCPVIHHIHNHYEKSTNKLKFFVKSWSIKNDLMLACGSGVRDSVIQAELKNETSYIDNGIDFTRLNQFEDAGFDSNKKQILMFGFDFKRKGVDLAVRACDSLIKAGCNINLNISLSRNHDAVKQEIISLLGRFPEWISLLPPRNDIATYYKGVKLFISPSREEGLCYSLIEAAYCGCIVVASHISGQYELDIPQIVWCQKEDSDDLARAIQSVFNMSSEEIKKTITQQQEAVKKKYAVSRWANDVMNYYSKQGIIDRKI